MYILKHCVANLCMTLANYRQRHLQGRNVRSMHYFDIFCSYPGERFGFGFGAFK